MASCTAVSVRDRGRFCFCALRERFERFGRGRMRREARIRTWRSENFFSSSRVSLQRRQASVAGQMRRREGHWTVLTSAGLGGSPGGMGRGQR